MITGGCQTQVEGLGVMAQAVLLTMFVAVVLTLTWKACHRLYREVLRRRQASTVRAALEAAAVQARGDQARRWQPKGGHLARSGAARPRRDAA